VSAGPPRGGAPGADRIGLGIASIVAAVFFFSIADALAKWLGQTYQPVQIVFLRYVFGLIPVALLIWRGGGPGALRTRRPLMHGLRALVIFAALLLLFTGLRDLPLAEAISVAFTAPLFVTALSGPLLGEPVRARHWAAVSVGFLGALIVMRPGTGAFQIESLFVLASALCFALTALITRHMSRTETNVALLTYTTLGAGLASLPIMPFVWRPPAPDDLWLFLAIGLIGGTAGYFVIQAYSNAPPAIIAPFDYTALIWAALIGWIVWREQPEPAVWLGAAVIAASGLYITHREARNRPAHDGSA
jgi:drug/metabolite transporter (DMT)-like permease